MNITMRDGECLHCDRCHHCGRNKSEADLMVECDSCGKIRPAHKADMYRYKGKDYCERCLRIKAIAEMSQIQLMSVVTECVDKDDLIDWLLENNEIEVIEDE